MAGAQLIGRERELAALDRCLDSERLLTVTGPGGCGKTRIALEMASRVTGRPDPLEAVVVALISARTGAEIVDASLRAVGAREQSGRTPTQVLLGRLRDRRVLLVLDNCEQLTDEVASLAAAVLRQTEGVHVLVTSRVPLGMAGEVVFPLEPLHLPDPTGAVAAIVRSDAGRLFVERAATLDPGFALTDSTARAVGRICRELDGLPLALELAAARVGDMSPLEIADALSGHGRLEALPGESAAPQHRSVRASLDWSYGLLKERERVFLRRLSVFAGGWSADAARTIALPEASDGAVRDLLDALAAKGLIMVSHAGGGRRWTLLQTVAEYLEDQLALDSDTERVRDRHLRWCCEYAAEADRLLLEPDAVAGIDIETPNLRLALARAMDREADAALGLVAALTRHWILAERFEEGGAAFDRCLSLTGLNGPAAARAPVLCGAGLISALSEDYENAVARTQLGLSLAAELPGVGVEARCLQMAGMSLILTGLDPAQGLRCANRAAELLRGSDDPLGLGWALVNVAMSAGVCDRFDAVRVAYEEFLAIPGAGEHPRLRTWAELAAAWVELIVGSPGRALAQADLARSLEGDRASMTRFIADGHRVHALALLGRAEVALGEGRAALARAHESGALMAVPAIQLALAVAEFMDGDLDAATATAQPLVQLPQPHTRALVREILGQIALARGDPDEAAFQARELLATAEESGSERQRAVAELILGRVEIVNEAPDRGRDRIQRALRTFAELGLDRPAADALEELGLLAASTGDPVRGARLAAAASAAQGKLGYVEPASSAARVDRARDCCVDHQAWDQAWAEGERLRLNEAVAYAQRGRGPRKRPPHGWASLTPAELNVAELAAGGMSNPQIAARLFISRGTVKMHLSNVYLKLQVANRTQLAAKTGQMAVVLGSRADDDRPRHAATARRSSAETREHEIETPEVH